MNQQKPTDKKKKSVSAPKEQDGAKQRKKRGKKKDSAARSAASPQKALKNKNDCPTAVMPRHGLHFNEDTDGSATRISDPVGIAKAPTQKKAPPPPRRIIKRMRPNSSMAALVFTLIYLAAVLIVSVGISFFAIQVANEAFAFKKEGVPVDVTLTGDYINLDSLAEQLHEQHVIRFPTIFKIYAELRHKADSEFVAGKYKDVSPEYGYDVLLALFLPETKGRQEISVSIPEGYTVDDIIELFVSKGIGTKEAFVEVINTYEFDTERYWFLQDVPLITDPENDPRIYRLEGFLYPDTYRFYDSYTDKEGDTPGTAAAKAVITKLLDQFKNNFKKSFFLKQQKYMEENFPDAPKLTVYEILTIASILEKEGVAEERNLISAVFYNRLQHPENEGIGGKLESNAVTQYALRHDGYKVSSEFGEFELNYETPYNSYKYAGLPPTPIVTPTLDSLNAALYPAEGLDYFFFVATDSGYSFFASTLAEHLENVERAKNGEVADSPFPDEEEGDDYP